MNHRTTKTSEKLDKKGFKLRINICNSRIRYDKKNDDYILLEDNTDTCNSLVKESPTNILEINHEISNYQEFRNFLKDYLGKNPNINYNDFQKEAVKFYNDKNYIFEISQNFYSNLYYNGKKLLMPLTIFYF